MFQRSPRASARRAVAWPRTVVVSSLLALACSAPPGSGGDYDDGPDEFGGALPGTPGAAAPTNPGAATTPGVTPAPSTPAPSAPPVANSGGGEQNPAAGAPITPSTTPPPSNTGANAGTGVDGAGGSSMVPANGAGGATSMPPAQQPPAQQPPAQQPPAQQPPAEQPPAQPAGPDIPCPADAFFCSGFEGADLPDGTNFVIGGDSSFPNQFAIDSSLAHSGQQSFAIPGPSPGFSYRALAVPAARQEYWARLFVQVGSEFGDDTHDSLFGASNANLTSDHNNETVIELSEQFGYMLLNTDDCTLNCNTPSPQLKLTANTWHCLEAHYDANTGHVEVFLEGDRFIDATQPAHQITLQTFRLGYMRFNTERSVWYDDVVLSASRVGCQ